MKNLVLTRCSYTWDKSKIFVKSLRMNGYTGDIVFIEGTQDQHTLDKYKIYEVSILPCSRNTESIINTYYSYLSEHFPSYDKVMFPDVRDVVFQTNPFDYMQDEYLHLTSEDLLINEQPLNAHWMRAEFGANMLQRIGNNKIVCAGIMYGGKYAALLWVNELKKYVPKVEQAVLNYLFYTGQLPEAVIDPNPSVVWTIGTKIDTEHDDFYKIQKHVITTLDNFAPPVIHQYDRHPRIKEMLEMYYA